MLDTILGLMLFKALTDGSGSSKKSDWKDKVLYLVVSLIPFLIIIGVPFGAEMGWW